MCAGADGGPRQQRPPDLLPQPGDIGEFDDEGYRYIRDRKKDLVIVGGYNVYPREVEEVLFTHPHVMDAAVAGQADAYRGEIPRAFVVMRPGQVFDPSELVEFCKANLAPHKVPARIDCLEALPKTSVNKSDKKELKNATALQPKGRRPVRPARKRRTRRRVGRTCRNAGHA